MIFPFHVHAVGIIQIYSYQPMQLASWALLLASNTVTPFSFSVNSTAIHHSIQWRLALYWEFFKGTRAVGVVLLNFSNSLTRASERPYPLIFTTSLSLLYIQIHLVFISVIHVHVFEIRQCGWHVLKRLYLQCTEIFDKLLASQIYGLIPVCSLFTYGNSLK